MKVEHKGILQKLAYRLKSSRDIIYDKDENKIGLIGKISLNNMEDTEQLIKKINKLKEIDTKYLMIENIHLFSREDINRIQNGVNLKILDGINVKSYFLPMVLKELSSILHENLWEKEILFFCGEKNITEKFILALSKEAKFITLVGDDEKIIEDISKSLFESTGLSIFHCKNIDRILKKYFLIVNLNENKKIDINKLRREAILFDFSFGEGAKGCGIVDFIFKSDRLNIKENSYIGENIPSYIYEYFNTIAFGDFIGLMIENQEYSPKKFINVKIRQSLGL